MIADASYIEYFEVEKPVLSTKSNIITLYDTNTDTQMLVRGLGIDVLKSRILDNQTVFLDHNQLQILFEKAPCKSKHRFMTCKIQMCKTSGMNCG